VGAAYRRTWVVLDERGETVTCTFSFPHAVDAAACYLAAAARELEPVMDFAGVGLRGDDPQAVPE
jgi:hypothetical protein